MAIDPLPSLDRTSPTFKTDVDTYFATQLPAFSVQTEGARVVIISAESTATAAASTATTQAGISTTGAGTATTQAGIATAGASTATTQAGIATAAAASITAQVSTAIHGASSKATPADNDELGLVDSAAGNVLKKLTWGNLKTALATLFAAKGANNDITSLTGLTSALYATGQCQLILSSGSLKLIPLNGNTLIVNGRTCTVPDAGVTLAATGLSATTFYYIYATASAGVVNALEASVTAHVVSTTAGNKGTRIKSGDDARSFVGWAYCVTAATFVDTPSARGVRSWFNDAGVTIAGSQQSITTAGNSFMEINSAGRAGFIVRAGEAVYVSTSSAGYTASTNNTVYSGIGLDGPTTNAGDYSTGDIASSFVGLSSSAVFEPAEGWHYVTPTMRTAGGFNGFVQSAVRGRVGK